MSALDEFTKELQRPEPQPERLALAIAGIAYPEIEIEHCLNQLDQLATYIAERLDDGDVAESRAQQFIQLFCEELGFQGNRQDYYHPDNSYLNRVLEDRRGLPIMLCLICVAVARRVSVAHHIDLAIDGIGFPGHFMACLRDPDGDWLLDPFNGTVVAPNEAAAYLGTIFGLQPTLDENSLRGVTPEAWAQRILFNLRNIYLSRRETDMSIRILDFLLVLMPRHPALWRERGMLHYQNEALEEAIRDLRRSFFLFGQYAIVWGDDQQRQALLAQMSGEERRVSELYQKITQMVAKQN